MAVESGLTSLSQVPSRFSIENSFMQYVWLQTTDGIPQKVESLAMFCPMIYHEVIDQGKGFLEDCPVLLPSYISTSILNFILDYCRFYHIPGRSQEECQVFNATFIYKDTKTLSQLGIAAISLGLIHLADLTLDELDRQTKGHTAKQVCKIFQTDNNNPFLMDCSRYQFMEKFFDRKKQEQQERLKNVEVVERPEDDRPIADLVEFINGKDGDTKGATTTKKKKKNRRKKEKANELCSKNTIDENHNKECMTLQASDHNENGLDENDFDDDLDPLKMKIIDRDVEEFKRRLNLSWKERISEMMNIKYK